MFGSLFLLAALLLQGQPAGKPPVKKPAVARPPAARTPARKPAMPQTDDEKTLYALGLSIANSVKSFNLTPAELELVKRGLSDGAANKPALPLADWQPKIRPLQESRFLARELAAPGAVKADSGLIYRDLTAGTGASPKATDTVKVNYRGTLVNGTEFDSSYSRNEPAVFALNSVIPCWTEGLQKMKVGGKATLVCPSEIAYGEQGRPSIPGGAALIFEIELLDITTAAPAQ
jgi:FKBP-type peptidyl-prolyl cis-trans isomerase FkpA